MEPAALAEFLPAWQGATGLGGAHEARGPRRGVEALVETVGVLAGAPIVASTLEADVLAARVAGYRSSMLDELCTSGDVVWLGAGAIGSSDGRVRLCFADQIAVLAPSWERIDPPTGALHDTVRQLLAASGASFWSQLRAGAIGPTDAELLAALWDLVWAGEVTNDSLAALRRDDHRGRAAQRGVPAVAAPGGADAGARLRLGRIGPAAGAGRWSLVAPLLEPRPDRHRIRPRDGDAARRASRRRHPRSCAGRRRRRRVRLRLWGAQGARGSRPGPARLLRQWTRCGPVRASWGSRPPAVDAPARRSDVPGVPRRRRRVRSTHNGGALAPPIRLSPTAAHCRGRKSPGRPARIGAASSCSAMACRWCGTIAGPTTS